jgi:glycosyltransferase involved in cell wall biosynthesis
MSGTFALNFQYSTTVLVNKTEATFEGDLTERSLLPKAKKKIGMEGGLRTQGYYKRSYSNDEMPVVNEIVQQKSGAVETLSLPLVSIITTVLNGEKYLEKTILSVLTQSYCNIEYIIIDGGSTDNTIDIIKKYESFIDYWISEPDKGIYEGMNKGIACSSGELIGIINADDWYEKDSAKSIVDVYCNEHNIDVVYGNENICDIDGRYKFTLAPRNLVSHSTFFVRRQIYQEYGLFDTSYKILSDYDFINRIKNKCNFHYCNHVIANFREGGISTRNYIKIAREGFKLRKKNNVNIFSNFLLTAKAVLFPYIRIMLEKMQLHYIIRIYKKKCPDVFLKNSVIHNPKG